MTTHRILIGVLALLCLVVCFSTVPLATAGEGNFTDSPLSPLSPLPPVSPLSFAAEQAQGDRPTPAALPLVSGFLADDPPPAPSPFAPTVTPLPTREPSTNDPTPPEWEAIEAQAERVVIGAINNERQMAGLPTLVPNYLLYVSAKGFARSVLDTNAGCSHYDGSGAGPATRARNAGYADPVVINEVIACGWVEPQAAVLAWMYGGMARTAILDARTREIGAAYAYAPDKSRGFVVVDMGARVLPTPSPLPSPLPSPTCTPFATPTSVPLSTIASLPSPLPSPTATAYRLMIMPVQSGAVRP